MDKRILIPTDFSKNALNAIRYAMDLYKKQRCEFYLLNVFQVDGYSTDSLIIPEPGNTLYESAKKEAEEGFAKLMDMLKLHPENPNHTFYTNIKYNFLSEAIKDLIAKKDIDLLVMGTKGATGAKGVIFGSNTVNAMEKIRECPVLAIPEDIRFSPPKEIVFPTNYKASFKRKELHYLTEVAKLHDASIRVLYVSKNQELNEKQEVNKQLLDDIFEDIKHSFHVITNKDISDGIISFVESRDSDMIAFINRKHFFFGSVFSKPLVKDIGYEATIPILALH
ncbi:universal stress protein [Maribacter sp. CXY002]|uniref:universal stress protein n=1 Tax=Maribacter luteocoastalis TaxID=3407671 RepID=UPI003B67E0D9